jgi:hypothetical protein
VAVVLAFGSLWYLGWQWVLPPAISCSVPDEEQCERTAEVTTSWYQLTGRPTAIDIRPVPQKWKSSSHPGVGADWAAKVERFLQEPVLAGCGYDSSRVGCWVVESVPASN